MHNKDALLTLLNSENKTLLDQLEDGEFFIQNLSRRKIANGQLIETGDNFIVELISTNYSAKYLRRKIRSKILNRGSQGTAKPLLIRTQRGPGPGDQIYTRIDAGNLAPGQSITLAMNSVYHGRVGRRITCHEQFLTKSFRASFQYADHFTCMGPIGTPSPGEYFSVFQLEAEATV